MKLPQELLPYKMPLIAFGASFLIFLLSLVFLQQGPLLESMEPRIGNAGQKVVLKGRYFGPADSAGWLSVAGQRLGPESIQSWDTGEIIFTVPQGLSSGPLVVHTPNGKSRNLMFTSRVHLPSLASSRIPGKSFWISSAEAPAWLAGMPCTLKGGSFGSGPDDGWLNVGGYQICGRDILSWTEDTIRFILPAYVGKTAVYLENARGKTGGFALPSLDAQWKARETVTYQLSMTAEIGEVELEGSDPAGLITAYLPRPENQLGQTLESFTGRDVQLGPDIWFFVLSNPLPDTSYNLGINASVRRTLELPASDADPGVEFADISVYKPLLESSRLVPVEHASIKALVAQAVPVPTTPLQRLIQVFSKVIQHLEPDPDAGFGYGADVLGDGKASSFGYADLTVAALRQAKIPALLVEGLLVAGGEAKEHFWVQALVPGLGWINFDPYEAEFDIRRQSSKAMRDILFESAGVNHIILTRGETNASLTRMDSDIRKSFQRNVLIGILGESSGNISSYGLFLPPVEVRKLSVSEN